MELARQPKRPKRLWVATILNILIAVIAVTFLVFLLISTRVPPDLKPSAVDAGLGIALALLLVIYSALALKGMPSARRGLLVVATTYYGIIIVQNALPIVGLEESVVPMQKLFANAVRNSVLLGITWWALSSAKTKLFFEAAALPSNNALERP